MYNTNTCPHCGDDIPTVLFDAHVAACDPGTHSDGSLLVELPDEGSGDTDTDRFPLPDSATFTTEGVREQPDMQRGVDPFDITDIAGAPPEGTKFESDVDEEFMRLVGQLDIDERIVDVNVALLDDMELSKRFSEVKQELLQRGEMVQATTQTGRDLHSERGAYLIELRRRGLA